MGILQLSCAFRILFALLGNRFMGGGKEEQTSEMVGSCVIPNWLAVFGAPEIMVAGKDSRFIGEVFQEFCNARNITLHAVIPGHRQSLGATERRHGLFRTIIDHVIGNRKPNSLGRKEWDVFAAMTMMRLNSLVRKFGGFAPGRRVCGGAFEMPIRDGR